MNNLLRLVGRRLVALPIMALGVTFLIFFLMSFSPIDPAYKALGESATPEQIQQYHEEYGLDDPWPVRYVRYMGDLLHGDLGTYSARRSSVADRVATALPVTMQLTFFGLLLGAVVSFLLGIIAALYRDRGYMGRMIMPAVALAVPLTGQMTRIVRTAMVEELDKDYVQTAKGSGLPQKVIIARNVLRNALITPVTTLGMKIGYLMGGAVVIEVIFNLPGMGMAILDGVSGNEPMLVMGVVIVVALSFIIINIVVDMLYLLINPRIRSV